MRYLTAAEVLALHDLIIKQADGSAFLRDLAVLESAVGQPRQTFGGSELYPTIAAKAAALGFSLIQNHPFSDGNKRIGHAATDVFLRLNGWKITAPVDDVEKIIMAVASGATSREQLQSWIEAHISKAP